MAVLFGAGLVVLGAMLRGGVLSVLWSWFLVPLGLPTIGIAMAFGISLIFAFLGDGFKSEDYDSRAEALSATFLTPLVALALGFIYSLFL